VVEALERRRDEECLGMSLSLFVCDVCQWTAGTREGGREGRREGRREGEGREKTWFRPLIAFSPALSSSFCLVPLDLSAHTSAYLTLLPHMIFCGLAIFSCGEEEAEAEFERERRDERRKKAPEQF